MGRKDREEDGRVCVGEPEMGAGEGGHNQIVTGRLDCIPQPIVSQNGVYISTRDDFRWDIDGQFTY